MLDLVLENRVRVITTADQVNHVVVDIKVVLANVLDPVLGIYARVIPTAGEEDRVVLMENVASIVLENLVTITATVHRPKLVAVNMKELLALIVHIAMDARVNLTAQRVNSVGMR